MKKSILILFGSFILPTSSAFAQAIDVTPAGINIGVTSSTTPGALFQQSGQDTSLWTQDGVNPADLRLIVKGNGNVGIGTDAPGEKLEVVGNTTTTGSATVGSLVVGSSPILSVGSFESAEQAIPGNGFSLTVPHGLGGLPRFTTVALRCKIAEYGWSAGDEILLNSLSIISNNHGVTTAVNETSFKMIQYGSIYIHRFSGGGPVAITAANWRLVFRAWR